MTDVITEYVDAHCHLDLFPDPVALLRRIDERRVHTIAVTNAPSVFAHTERLALGSRYLRAAAGLHPELVATHGGELDQLWPCLERTRYVGEVGLDYSTNDAALRTRQRAVFDKILERCAALRDKTITVHSRRASSDTIDAIGERYPGKVILHWFTGTRREVERAARLGLYFSINRNRCTDPRVAVAVPFRTIARWQMRSCGSGESPAGERADRAPMRMRSGTDSRRAR